MMVRFPESYSSGVFNSSEFSQSEFAVIKKYAYYDIIESSDIFDLLDVYHWALTNRAPERFCTCLFNRFIANVKGDNCISAVKHCKRINRPEFQKLQQHCLGYIWKKSAGGFIAEIKDMADNTMLLFEAMSMMFPLIEEVTDIPPSTYRQDISKLFNCSDATTKLKVNNDMIGIVPAILESASEYFHSLLKYDPKDCVELFVDLSREEYEQLSDADKNTRANALYKILEYCHTGHTDIAGYEYMIWHFTCLFQLPDLKRKTEKELISALTRDNAMKMAELFPIHNTDNHNLRVAVINVLHRNWTYIKSVHKPDELKNYLSQEFMSELLLKFDHSETIVSGSEDNSIKVWNVNTGQCLNTFTGHTYAVLCILKLDADRIVSGSYDNSIKVWNVNTGQCLKTFTGHTSSVCCLSN